jgi:hypothetical protein
MSGVHTAPTSAAAESFDNAPSPITPHSTDLSESKHDPSSKEDASDVDGLGVHELHAAHDAPDEYKEFMDLHQRYNGTKEWSKVLWKMDVSE